jgi:murein L,D-transpeptidase YcbB/YkuD
MQYVVFQPYWYVPRSITRDELLPSIRKNAGYVARHGYEIVDGYGANDVLPATAESIAMLESGAAKLRQRPGKNNALGLVKFIFPNPKNVYLHDTPAKALFRRSRRDFSHGCIRVADPAALARFVLDPTVWNEERIERAMKDGTKNRRVDLPAPVQVLLYYTTAVVEENGEVRFFDDIYGHDLRLAKLLATGYRFGS